MSLSSDQLDTFYAVSQMSSFSKAAQVLRITQSALSQRVIKLERELGTTLFVREPSGVRLTSYGTELLRYCQAREAMEREVLSRLRSDGAQPVHGIVRIAAFSSVWRSMIFPALDDLIQAHPGLEVEIRSRELRDLPRLLKQGEVDYIITDRHPSSIGITSHFLGREENVLVRSNRKARSSEDYEWFLEHDLEDATTERFFRIQNQKPNRIRRRFLDDIYGILDGVRLGWGQAVLPKHLVKNDRSLKVVSKYKSLYLDVHLQHYEHAYYTGLHHLVIKALTEKVPVLLTGR